MSNPNGVGGGCAEKDVSAPGSLSDEQLARLPKEELIARLRHREGECVKLMRDRAQLMKDVNRTLQLHLAEVRGLREVNQALQKDNAELRDLSCFLDDDRLKARKIAKEWQKFGKYTSTVMKQEVTAYQMKLYELEQKQESLLNENVELKELCLYLDDDRESRRGLNHVAGSGTHADDSGTFSDLPHIPSDKNAQNSSREGQYSSSLDRSTQRHLSKPCRTEFHNDLTLPRTHQSSDGKDPRQKRIESTGHTSRETAVDYIETADLSLASSSSADTGSLSSASNLDSHLSGSHNHSRTRQLPKV